jgi:hypothetical protein
MSRPIEPAVGDRAGGLELDPAAALVVVIDAQEGFAAKSGALGRVFGGTELEPLRAALEELSRFLAGLPEAARVLLVA